MSPPSALPDAVKNLRIAVAGGGIGGVSAALALERQGFSNIEVFESASKLGEVGAGINVGPNLYRVLKRYGVADRLHDIGAVGIQGTSIRRGADDKELAFSEYKNSVEKFQAPIWVCHRADLHRCMVEAVEKTSVILNLGCEVTAVDFKRPALKFRKRKTEDSSESDWREFDLIIAADGVKSNIRRQMLALKGEVDEAQDTGQAAYRILIPREIMAKDPELLELIDTPVVTRWIAHRRHIIAYPISNKSIYNISTAHPDEHIGAVESWTAAGSYDDMRKMWADYCPRIQKMLDLVPNDEILEWKLRVHLPLTTWIEGNVVLVGDASHPTLPHLAQGAAQAVEDGAVLATLLAKIKSKEEIPAILALFERARKSRVEEIVEGAHQNGKRMQLATGPESEARDKAFEAVKSGGENPDASASARMQDFLFGFDCIADAERLYATEYQK